MTITMKLFATSEKNKNSCGNDLVNLPVVAFICTLLLAGTTMVTAEPYCNSLSKSNCKTDSRCSWLKKKQRKRSPTGKGCVAALTQDEKCSIFTGKKKKCKRKRCKWNEEDKTCLGNGVGEAVPNTGNTGDRTNGIFDEDFLESLVGMDGEEARRLVEDKNVLICSYEKILNAYCVTREDDQNRIKLMVGETNKVFQVFDNGIFDKKFIETLEGMDGEAAKTKINDLVVAICSHGASSVQCLIRNEDASRLKLIVDVDNIVEEAVWG
uniref:Uncharacterized protein n=1 Tax=Pseudo-nitzschia australis TaxID=44445 RepID=A0A7S4EQP8_9STRA